MCIPRRKEELKRHVERAGHRPSKYKETCYTCKKEFYGYFELMAHRNYEHPSNKVCRYFKRDECIFSSEKCWYKHTTQSENDREKQVSEFPCQHCNETFKAKKDFMMHMKRNHISFVPKCRDFESGKCRLTNYWCWFKHEEDIEKYNGKMDESTKNISDIAAKDDQVFCETTEKIPPDQTSQILKMIKDLSLQMKNLQNQTKMSSNSE